jgi:hypothetical protein
MSDLSREPSAGGDESGRASVPVTRAGEHFAGLRNALARLASAGVTMALPVEIREWRGEAAHGCFVQIDASTCALHIGRGRYVALDIQRDLNGVTPNEATRLKLQRSGIVRKPDMHRSYGA